MESEKKLVTDAETHLCRRCGRKLKNLEAKKRGFGEVCYRKWMSDKKRTKLLSAPSLQSKE